MTLNQKKVPQSVLIFGAGGRTGSCVARSILDLQPSTQLRLATTHQSKVANLKSAWPSAEVVVADFTDEPSLHEAVKGIEGVVIITPGSFDERVAMNNMVRALKKSGDKLVHVIRFTGMFPGFNPRRVPKNLIDLGLALPIQSHYAKEVLDESLLPVTYINTGTSFNQNFYWMKRSLKDDQRLIWPSRLVPYMDLADIGEITARVLLSPDHRHIGQFHTVNNGTDLLRIEDVAEIMSRVWQVDIKADTSWTGFAKEYTHIPEERRNYLWEFFKFEEENEVAWSLNDFAERVLGRKPKTLEQWLAENRSGILE